jgi:hypothetical protein
MIEPALSATSCLPHGAGHEAPPGGGETSAMPQGALLTRWDPLISGSPTQNPRVKYRTHVLMRAASSLSPRTHPPPSRRTTSPRPKGDRATRAPPRPALSDSRALAAAAAPPATRARVLDSSPPYCLLFVDTSCSRPQPRPASRRRWAWIFRASPWCCAPRSATSQSSARPQRRASTR